MRDNISIDRLRDVLNYDVESGIFTWKHPRQGRRLDRIVGSDRGKGYLSICIDGTTYFSHRLAFAYVNGRWPSKWIDHINGDRSDNRISNLREASSAENNQNRLKESRRSTSGFLGVSSDSKRKKFAAAIQVDGKSVFLGRFNSPEIAHEAYLIAKSKLHPFFAQPQAPTHVLTSVLRQTFTLCSLGEAEMV